MGHELDQTQMGPRFCSEEEWKLSKVDMGMVGRVEYVGGLWQIGGLRKEISVV